MLLSEIHIIKKTDSLYNELLCLCHKSKNLYNAGLYEVRQHFFKTQKFLNYFELDKLLKETKNSDYYGLAIDCSQQILKIVNQDFKSFFSLLKLKKEGKYEEKVSIPRYKKKDGYFNLCFNSIKLGKKCKQEGICKIPNTNIKFKIMNYETCKQVRIIPCNGYLKIENLYEVNNKELKEDNGNYLSIDLGLNNLAACTSNIIPAFLINGKRIKHINQYYNKRKANLQSKLKKDQYTSKQIIRITNKRNFRIDNYFHNVSKYIINQVVSNNINTIIIGKNDNWKQEINLGNVNNQNFVQIPFNKLISQLKYKGQLYGINVVTQEESYTSKSSFLDNDLIPVYGEDNSSFNPSGKRIKRGLYKLKNGKLINADINGSLNIMKKYLKCNSDEIISPADEGLVVNPIKIAF